MGLLFLSCSSTGMLKRAELERLQKKYDGVYAAASDIDIGNNQIIESGTRFRLFFDGNMKSVKVYAFPEDQPREQVLGSNILYIFKTDFPQGEYSGAYLEKELQNLIKRIN